MSVLQDIILKACKHAAILYGKIPMKKSSSQKLISLISDQYKTYIPAGDQIIDVIPQEFTVDNFQNIPNPIGYSGVKVGANFHIITGDKNAIRNINRSVEKAGLQNKGPGIATTGFSCRCNVRPGSGSRCCHC